MVSRSASPTFPEISSACSITPAKLEYCCSHFTAVFGPTVGTPGILSEASPDKVKKSTICSGGNPNFSITPDRSVNLFFMVSSRVILSETSCVKSLSPVAIRMFIPLCSASLARVPITSSASTPFTRIKGKPRFSIAVSRGSIWMIRSSGVLLRLALYSGNNSCLKVFPGASKTMPSKFGLSSLMSLCNIVNTP